MLGRMSRPGLKQPFAAHLHNLIHHLIMHIPVHKDPLDPRAVLAAALEGPSQHCGHCLHASAANCLGGADVPLSSIRQGLGGCTFRAATAVVFQHTIQSSECWC